MKRIAIAFVFSLFLAAFSPAQPFVRNADATAKIQFPDIPGYFTLKCDFHMHSVFSDGSVWPTVRVEEALAEGLDVIALTDHVEYHPKKEVVWDNRVATDMVIKAAKDKPLIVISGGEISATPDHFNALFINNQNDTVLRNKVPAVRIKAAKDQGGFVFWNHPGWTSRAKDGCAPVDEGFYKLMEEGKINGIEICNGSEFWPEVFGLANKYHLTLFGNSDIHGISHYAYTPESHRTVTLVFAKEKTEAGVREALENQHTAVYANNYLIGRPDVLKEVFLASLEIKTTYQKGTTLAVMKITNSSDLDFQCKNTGNLNFHNAGNFFTLPAHATTTLIVRTLQPLATFSLDLVVENLITGPRESLAVAVPVNIL
jgi:hypothetical protein